MKSRFIRRKRWNPCPEDQFYDSVVESCSTCAEICSVSHQLRLCVYNCPEYYQKHSQHDRSSDIQLNTPISVSVSSSSASHSSSAAYGVQMHQLINKPLFWTSVVSICISILAAIGIVVVCVVRWREAGRRSVRRRRTYAACSDNTSADDFQPEKYGAPKPDGSALTNCKCIEGNHPIWPKTPPVGYMAKTSSNKGYSFISQPESFDYQLRTGSLISNAQGRNPSSDYLVTPSSTGHVKLSGLLIESHHDHHLLPTHSTSRDISNNSTLNLSIISQPTTGIETFSDRSSTIHTSSIVTPSSLQLPQVTETSVKHLPTDEESSDSEIVSLSSETELIQLSEIPITHVPGSRPRRPAFLNNETTVFMNLRADTGYLSEQMLVG